MHLQKLTALSIAMGITMIASGYAAEKSLTRAQLPAAVEKTVAAESLGATIKGLSTEVEGGRRVYEAQLVVNGHERDISMNVQGEILEVEEEVPLVSLPEPVKAGLAKGAGTGTISKVESLTKRGKLVAYEAVVLNGKAHREIQVGPDGHKLAHPE